MSDIVFYEVFAEEESALKHFLPPDITAEFHEGTIQEVGEKQLPASIISIRTQSLVPENWTGDLQAILTRSTGYDHLVWLHDRPVQIGYLPDYCARSVAEHALLLWTALLKKLPAQQASFATFNRNGLTGQQLLNKSLLVIGVGKIGYHVVQLAQAVGMHVAGMDIEQKHDNVNYVDQHEDLSRYDVIVSAMSLNENNIHYFDQQFFDRVKPGCLFVNISRGELSPCSVLIENLSNGRLAGVALDVFEDENRLAVQLRNRATNESHDTAVRELLTLASMPNTILTPHNAFNTHEATLLKSEQSLQQLIHYLQHGRFIWSM